MANLFKNIGSWARSIQGWFWMCMTGAPAAVTWIGGLYDGLSWAHTIALTTLALAGGGIFAASLVSVWGNLVSRKEQALIDLGELWEDGVDFRGVASQRSPPLTNADKARISDFEKEIIRLVGVVSKPAQSRFRRMNTINWPDHPPEVQLSVRGGEIDLGVFSEILKRVDEFIREQQGKP